MSEGERGGGDVCECVLDFFFLRFCPFLRLVRCCWFLVMLFFFWVLCAVLCKHALEHAVSESDVRFLDYNVRGSHERVVCEGAVRRSCVDHVSSSVRTVVSNGPTGLFYRS